MISIAADNFPSPPTPAASTRMRAFDPFDQSLIAPDAGSARSPAAATATARAKRRLMAKAYRSGEAGATNRNAAPRSLVRQADRGNQQRVYAGVRHVKVLHMVKRTLTRTQAGRGYLDGHFLIAMPGMADDRFARS